MIAEVYPILKLPRRCDVFDYTVPVTLTVGAGDLVRIPFRGREVFGIVKALKAHTVTPRLVLLSGVAIPHYLSCADVERYETIATCLVQSVSSLLQTVFTGKFFAGSPEYIQATNQSHVTALDIPVLEHCLSELNLNKSLAIAGDRDLGFALAYVLRRKRKGQMLILLSREHDSELLARYVKFGESACLLNGQTPAKQRSRIVEAWRDGSLQTLIGTRLASLLPAARLTTLLVLESGDEEHINTRRNPRFGAREAGKLLALSHNADYVAFDSLPRLEDLAVSSLLTTLPTASESGVINLAGADEQTRQLLLSNSVITGIEKALHSQKKVLIYLNRKGVAKRLQCGHCGHIPLCGNCGHVPLVRQTDLVCAKCQSEMWLPTTCPSCGQPKLGLRGIGGQKIATSLQQLFPHASIGQIEKDQVNHPEADILVVTEYFFSSYREPFATKHFGLVVDLAADISLHASDFRGAEETARKLHRLIGFAHRQSAELLVQTWLPTELRAMLNLPLFIANELDVRKRYNLPPFAKRVIIQSIELAALPDDLAAHGVERSGNVDLSFDPKQPLPASLILLSDSLKLNYDGAYVQSPDSPT